MNNNSKFLSFLVACLFLLSCKRTGHYDFEKREDPPEYETSDLIWKNDTLGASLFIKNDHPKERGNLSWLELQVKNKDETLTTYVYYYIDMNYGGIRNDTLLLADLKKETNSYVGSPTWYFIDSSKNIYEAVEYYLEHEKLDSLEKFAIINRMTKLNPDSRGIYKVTKSGSIEKVEVTYEKFNPNMIDASMCHDCLFYFNISKRINKYYALNEIVRQIKESNKQTILPSYTKEGSWESFEE